MCKTKTIRSSRLHRAAAVAAFGRGAGWNSGIFFGKTKKTSYCTALTENPLNRLFVLAGLTEVELKYRL